MTYLEKESRLIEAMNRDNFSKFDGDKDMAYDMLERCFDSFPDYANTVIRMQTMVPIWSQRYDGQELRDRIQDIDQTRRIKHDGAISSLGILNRLSTMHGLEPFADVDTSDRYAVADFVGRFVSETYADGTHTSMDALVKDHPRQEFPKGQIRSRIADLDAKFGDIIDKEDKGPEYE